MNKEDRLELYFTMKKKGLRLQDVAREIDVSTSLLSQFLNYKCNMSIYNVKNLEEFLNKKEEVY
ncbi:helix-turn-helix domain-containing protein [Psychrobacillus sp. BM2]|uniref:helix-turn-helix domain-containing protein n=1 Tax=Psychrobacillus sp. BM2 TaxID=3400421 RepID=UPI003B023D09